MDIADFLELKDQEKQILFEQKPGIDLASWDWLNLIPAWNCYQLGDGATPWVYGEIVEIVVNGSAYDEVFSVFDCDASASTWYYDDLNKHLYIHMADSDDPSTQFTDQSYKYVVMAYFWEVYTNRQDPDSRAIYERFDELLYDGDMELWITATNLYGWTEFIGGGTSSIDRSTDTWDDDSAYSCKISIDAVPNLAHVSCSISTKPHRKHRLIIRYKADNTFQVALYDSTFAVVLGANSEWGATLITLPASAVWTTFEIEFPTHPSYSNYILYLMGNQANSTVYLDRCELHRIRQEMYYKPFLHDNSIPSIYHAVGDYHVTDERIQYGSIDLINPSDFYQKKNIGFNWHNKKALLKIQETGAAYYDYSKIFDGLTRKPSFSDMKTVFNLKDTRLADLTKIPRERFDATTFPNVDPRYLNRPMPLLFGDKNGIVPICEDTTARIYRISQTVFNSTTYALQSIDAVYADEVVLTVAVDYTVDLNNGRFTLLIDPGNALITCDAHGIQCDFETAATYSDNVADILHFILVHINNVDHRLLDYPSLIDLKAGRTQAVGFHLDTEVETLDIFRILKQSAIFHVFTLLNGKYVFKRYVAGTDADTPRFRTEDYHSFDLEEITDQAFKSVIVKYDQDPGTKEWKEVSDEYAQTQYKHDQKSVLIINTALTAAADALSIRDFYLRLLRDPSDRIYATLPARSLLINPAEKGIFDRHITDHEGNEISVLSDEVYRILELRKSSQSGTSDIVGIKDMQAAGFEFHSDVAHEDDHGDTHGDSHTDQAHGDTAHTDTHSDVAHEDDYYDSYEASHEDYAHQDTAHTDSHSDTAYQDHHTDSHDDHSDGGPHDDHYNDHHTDNAHSDSYSDEAHQDVPHTDEHTDDHTDAHSDTHTDTHGDVAHVDEGHGDDHSDSHSDYHDDVAHGDSFV